MRNRRVPPDSTIRLCQALIRSQLPIRYPTVDQVAHQLETPVRTLQRRLQETGLSYSQLVEETRLELACRLLEDPGGRVAEIARTLGYADPSSFSRAFKRWLSVSPRVYRQQVRAQSTDEH